MTQPAPSRALGGNYSLASRVGLALINKFDVLLDPVATLFVLIYLALVPGHTDRDARNQTPIACLSPGDIHTQESSAQSGGLVSRTSSHDQPGVDGLLCFADSSCASRLPRAQAYPTLGEPPGDGGFLIYKSATCLFGAFRKTGRIREQSTHDSGGMSGCRSVIRL